MMIGSHIKSTLRLVGLLAVLMLTIFAVYLALARLTDAPLFVLVLIIFLTVAHRLLNRRAAAMWTVFLTKDAAYGRVTESGIEYNEFFWSHFADWSQIRCVEHFADTGRTKIYLFGKSRPVQFGRSEKEALHDCGTSGVRERLKNQVQYSGGNFIEHLMERNFTR